jgi:1-acyl-sn-glycerol-3-phosphate acyltransferase
MRSACDERAPRPHLEGDASPYSDRTDDRFIDRLMGVTRVLRVYFRFRVTGMEHVPPGATLLVANHSIAGPLEITLIQHAWRTAFGRRPIRGLTHEMAWKWPWKHFPIALKMGAILARPDVAAQTLTQGKSVLVFPGGEAESLRPFSRRYDVDLGGRVGFMRLARQTGVPITPWVLCGAHAVHVVLPGGRALSRLLGLDKRMRLKAVPLTGGLVLLLAAALTTAVVPAWWLVLPGAALLASLPLPSRIELRVLPPFTPRADESDAQAAKRLQGDMQRALQDMGARRRTPWG